MRNQEIDIAIDLKGYTQNGKPFLLNSRPAPIQINYLGYPASMGMPYMDYFVGDNFTLTEENRKQFKGYYYVHGGRAERRERDLRTATRKGGEAWKGWEVRGAGKGKRRARGRPPRPQGRQELRSARSEQARRLFV